MKLKKNDTVEIDITSLNNLGFGTGRVGGLVVFVDGAVMGERVLAKVIKVAPSYAVARTERVLIPSPHRVDDRCPVSACKSCAYKSISYEREMKQKRENVIAEFKKAALPEVSVAPLVSTKKICGYRNKAQYPVSKNRDGEYIIGFFAPKSHRVTEAAECPLAPEIFRGILELLRTFFKKHNLSVYDEATGQGLLRHIYLRRAEIGGEILLTLVINGKSLPHSDELVSLVKESYPELCGILLNINEKNTNVILGDEYVTLYGRDYIFDTLAGVRLKISAPSFYQVNREGAELLYAKARELARLEPTDVLVDLYCGAGSIGLSMADAVAELYGVEIVESAVLCAKENAENNGITNAKFYTGDAADTERLLEGAERDVGKKILPDVVIVDPPRAGCDERLIKYIASLSPKRVVYISCNPATLARDCAIFKSLGFNIGEVTPVDMFPGTGHVESVVCLRRQIQQ